MTATRWPRTGRMMTGPRRMIHAVRYVNDREAGGLRLASFRVTTPLPHTAPGGSRPGGRAAHARRR